MSLHVGGPYGTKIMPSGIFPAWHLNWASPNSVRTTAHCPSASPTSAISAAAIVIAVIVMMLAAGTISEFIDKHPTLKILALSFLIVVGTLLVAEAFDVHVPKGYVYFAMAFSLGVEALNIRMRRAMSRKLRDPLKLNKGQPD